MWGFCLGDFCILFTFYTPRNMIRSLYSEKYDKIYVGYTSNLEVRLLSHNILSKKGWTVRYRPWKLIYNEEYENKVDALRRERELKSHKGRDFIRTLI